MSNPPNSIVSFVPELPSRLYGCIQQHAHTTRDLRLLDIRRLRLDDNFNISYGGNAGRIESGVAYGDLNYKNHGTGDHIHVQNVTDYGHPTTGPLSNFPDSRFAVGSGTINGEGSHLVEFRFVDIAEPGSDDLVWLRVDGVVLMDVQPVDGGNVQLHKNCKKSPTDEKH